MSLWNNVNGTMLSEPWVVFICTGFTLMLLSLLKVTQNTIMESQLGNAHTSPSKPAKIHFSASP